MKLQQLLFLHEVIKHQCNISLTAKALFTSQPGISKCLQQLEDELEVELFQREGRQLKGLTPQGEAISSVVANILADLRKIQQIAKNARPNAKPLLEIVSTRYIAEHILLPVLARYYASHPEVEVNTYEDIPERVTEYVLAGEADIGILSDLSKRYSELVYFCISEWRLILLTHRSHPLLDTNPLTLRLLAEAELVTYNRASVARKAVDAAFAAAGLQPKIVHSLSSTELILADLATSKWVGILAESAFNPEKHPDLVMIGNKSLFPPLSTWICIRKQAFLRGYVYDFISLLQPELDRQTIQKAQHNID